MSEETENVAEVKISGKWQAIDLDTALGLHRSRVLRCVECHGRVRSFKTGSNGQKAHMEHDSRNPGCSRGDCFDGTARTHFHPLS